MKMSLRYVEWSRSVQSRRWFSLWNWITAVWWTATDDVYFNTSHHNISIHLLLTLLHTFLLALMRRIRLMIKASFIGHHYLYSHDFNEWFSILLLSGETRCWSLVEFLLFILVISTSVPETPIPLWGIVVLVWWVVVLSLRETFIHNSFF